MVQEVTSIIYEMETELIESILKLLATGTVGNIDIAIWKAEKLQDLGTIKKLNFKIIDKNINKAVKIALSDIQNRGLEAAKIMTGGNTLLNALPITADPRLVAVWGIYERKSRDELYRLGAKLLNTANDAYVDIIEKTTAQVLAGQITFDKALRNSVSYLNKRGFSIPLTVSTRQWTTEGYVSMVMRSNLRQVVTHTQLDLARTLDLDLVDIDSHVGARPGCEPYQAKTYSISGTNPDYPALDSTTYGEIDGLFGINCGHRMYPHTPGVENTYDTYNKDKNDEVYKQTQIQRYNERQIRAAKRNLAIEEKLGDDDKITAAKNNLKAKFKKQREFIKDTGLTRISSREQIF